MTRTVRWSLALVAPLLLLLGTAPALAQVDGYPPSEPAAAGCSQSGSTVTCATAEGVFPAGASVTVTIECVGTLSTTADEDGRAVVTFSVPSGCQDQPLDVVFSDGTTQSSTTVEVDSAAAGAGPSSDDGADAAGLPATGGDFTVGMAIAAAALLLGAGLLIYTRKRGDEEITTR